jgi:hypothetical protein
MIPFERPQHAENDGGGAATKRSPELAPARAMAAATPAKSSKLPTIDPKIQKEVLKMRKVTLVLMGCSMSLIVDEGELYFAFPDDDRRKGTRKLA